MIKNRSILAFALSLIFMFSTCSTSAFAGSGYITYSALNEHSQLKMNSFSRSAEIYIGAFYGENSHAGYINIEQNGVKGKIRVREIKLVDNERKLYNSKALMNLYRGQSKTIGRSITDSKTTTISKAISVTAGAEGGILGKASVEVKATLEEQKSWSHSYTISSSDTYTFPSNMPNNISYVNIYSGFTNDIYEAVVDFVPYETYDKKTKVDSISVTSPARPRSDNDDPRGNRYDSYEIDVTVYLADGRRFEYHSSVPPHHFNAHVGDLSQLPEAKRFTSQFSDGYYHEYTSGYNYDNKEVVKHIVKVPIPSIKHVGIE